jgi:hypothetical protein
MSRRLRPRFARRGPDQGDSALTVVVGVAAYDGIILAADSRSTWFQPEGVRARVISDNAIKLFTVGNCAIATYGTAIIGPQSIAGLIDEFVAQLDDTSIEAETLARELGDSFADRFNSAYPDFDADNGWALGFLVAGYNGDGVGRLYEVLVPTREVTEHVSTQTLGGITRGQYDIVDRVIYGVDWHRLLVDGISEEVQERLGQLRFHLILPSTLQDAIDFAMFIIRTTIDMQRFSDGTLGNAGSFPTCGGPIRVLSVTRGGVEWIADRPLTAPAHHGHPRAEGETD